ncbi:MAG: hypothetical protein DMD40_13230 [Gemmatimonadetes bacterium]|nr:MAG: hypothetical protein DMD40_13230 [Gemmatimonadota bacterium]
MNQNPSPPPSSPLLLGDEWEDAPRKRARVVVIGAALIGVVLIATGAALLRSRERMWEPETDRVWNPIGLVPAALSSDTDFRAAPVIRSPSPDEPAVSAAKARRSQAVKAPGYLSINSSPWAQVLVDGRAVGTTPRVRIRVTAGRHHLLLVREGFQSHSAWVIVPAGGTVRLTDITLSKITR